MELLLKIILLPMLLIIPSLIMIHLYLATKKMKVLEAVQQKSKPEHWAEIYVERDRARIKQAVLNRVMERGSTTTDQA